MKYLIFIVLFSFSSCAGAMKKGQEKPNDSLELKGIVLQYHQQMRWGLWEKASLFWTESTRQAFIGRFEELGEDYKITDLEIKLVTQKTEKSTVEVEQQWYHEPNMTLQKARFIEEWVVTPAGWRLEGRLKKKEYRAKEKAAKEKAIKEKEAEKEGTKKLDDEGVKEIPETPAESMPPSL